jgi:hypothetical protein
MEGSKVSVSLTLSLRVWLWLWVNATDLMTAKLWSITAAGKSVAQVRVCVFVFVFVLQYNVCETSSFVLARPPVTLVSNSQQLCRHICLRPLLPFTVFPC